MAQIKILRPAVQDKEAIRALLFETVSIAFKEEGLESDIEGIQHEVHEKMGFLDADLQSSGKDHFWLIAKIGDQVVATIAFGPCGELIIEGSKGALAGYGEIGSVMVLPDYQRKGIGIVLFNAMILALSLKNIEAFVLDSGYTRAKQIWTKILGTPTYCMKDQWGEDHDHLIWFRRLDEMDALFYINSSH